MERTVRAKADGMAPNGSHVRQGAKFTVEDGEFAPSWMEPVDWTPPEPPKAETVADVLAAKDARIAELAEQVTTEQAKTAQILSQAKEAINAAVADTALDIELKNKRIAELEGELEAARKAGPAAPPEPEPAAKTATKTK